MVLQPKTAINFRSVEERRVLQSVLEKQGYEYYTRLNDMREGRAYLCPKNYRSKDNIHIETWDYPDEHCSADDDDKFKWTYVEAADVLRNLIIAERRKNAT